MTFYTSLLRPLLFRLAPETAHNLTLSIAGPIAACPPINGALARLCHVADPRLQVQTMGLTFPNPFGLAAGMDKEAAAIPLFSALGFGHLELGTVTPLPQPGNSMPRIFRLPKDHALINRMGFPSHGSDALAATLQRYRAKNPHTSHPSCILGINLGKNKSTPIENATQDYLTAFTQLQPYADYVVLNVSSPNTPDLRKLQEKPRLAELFAAIGNANPRKIPVLVKIAPDLSDAQLADVLEVCLSESISGLIATNTTFSRDGLATPSPVKDQTGGLSGSPLHQRSLAFVSKIYQATGGQLPIIGVGGISTAQHAYEMLQAGASLLQIYTGLIYEGPFLIHRLNRGLLALMDQHEVTSLASLRGSLGT